MLYWTVRSPAVISSWWFLLWSTNHPIMSLRGLTECQKLQVRKWTLQKQQYRMIGKTRKDFANKTVGYPVVMLFWRVFMDIGERVGQKEEGWQSKSGKPGSKFGPSIVTFGTWLCYHRSPLKWLVNHGSWLQLRSSDTVKEATGEFSYGMCAKL